MNCLFRLLLGLVIVSAANAAPLVFQGAEGPGKGKHLVFIAGDHEYRSEETLPAMARLLAKHHGFKCTVLFDIDADGNISAGDPSNIPGLEALATADLAVVFLRFQHLPAEQMKHIDEYLKRGGPVVGLRTATHAFSGTKEPYAKYNYNAKEPGYELGFGHQVLGQTWVGHYGRNHQQSTRITIAPDKKDHPILRGVKDVWVQVGGYVGKPTDGEILTLAQPLNGMTPDSPADATNPPQPSEWTRTYKSASGKVGRVFTTLYGTSEDITNEGYRRLVVNGIFWAVSLESAIKPDLNVAFVGPFKPNTYNSGGYARGIKPEMYAGFESPIPANNNTKNPNPPAKRGEGKKADAKKADAKPAPAPVPAKPDAADPTCGTKVAAAPVTKPHVERIEGVVGKPARFIRVELPGDKRILTLAEVEVFAGGKNVALGAKSTQSSTHGNSGAEKAVDGNKSPDFGKGGQTHTVNAGEKNPWWEADLGQPVSVERIQIWNRSGFESRLDGFTVKLLDADRKEVFQASSIVAAQSLLIGVQKPFVEFLDYDGKPAKPGQFSAQPAAKADSKAAKNDGKKAAPTGPSLADVPADYRDPLPFKFNAGDNVAILGNGLPDRMQHDGWFETLLQSQLGGQQVRFRNLSASGDRPNSYPRSSGIPSITTYLQHVKADVVFAFFGYNESFDGKPEDYQKQLVDFVRRTRGSKANGKSFPRIVLFSPIAHEDTRNPNVPDGKAHNVQLEAYTKATEAAAKEAGVAFVDLFHPSLALFKNSKTPLTINGVHLTEEGNRQLAEIIAQALLGKSVSASGSLESLRAAVLDKDTHWHARYRSRDANDVFGGRSTLKFVDDQSNAEVLQHELKIWDVLTANRDERVWARAVGKDKAIDDSNVPKPVPVISNVGGKSKSSSAVKEGALRYISGEEGLKHMAIAKGFEANLFADEARFPQLINPVQMQVDAKGRLWASVWPTYPMWEPLKPMNDALLIFHDDNNDGKADRVTEFAKIQNPLGFEFWGGGVLVTCPPEIVFLKDTDGDDKADVRIVMLQGLDSSDTHHGANNLIYGPDGGIYWQSGVFMMHNHEHPWGPSLQTGASAMYRFDPRRFTIAMHAGNSPNPHGIAFDRWGYHYATDGTGGNAFQVRPDGKGFKMFPLLKKEVRPVTASEVVSSTHFPEAMQGDFLICNVIGFLGIKHYALTRNPTNGTVWGEPAGDELTVMKENADGTKTEDKSRGFLMSGDKNFRPSDAIFGADGALYVADWHNVIIGHMQHNVRDPNRDHKHGRIYRVTAKGRPLQKPVTIAGAPIPALLENLKHPADGVRHRTRVELSARDTKEVIAATQSWLKQFDPTKAEHAHHLLEGLWLHQQHNVQNAALLDQVLKSPEPHARIAANTVKHLWFNVEASTRGGVIAGMAEVAAQKSGILSDTPALTTIRIGTIPEKMMYDVKQIAVKPGKKIKLTFANPDFMPHNILLVKPGKADEIGMKAMALGAKGFEVNYVPESSDILWASKLLDHGKEQVIEFTAPQTEGAYPYVCSFPGHHLIMRGTLIVANNPAEFLAKNPEAAPKITEWKLADFADDLKRVGTHRNFARGQQTFTALACAQCHQLGKEGVAFGPSLSDVVKKYKGDAKAVLQEILEPSKAIEEKYRNVTLELGDENSLSGLILAEDASSVTIQAGPAANQIQKIAKSAIKSRKVSALSLMPAALLNALDKEQVLDLLAFILAGGSADHAAFKHAH
jgi:putative membrane-bound dehydrogenase-like protein